MFSARLNKLVIVTVSREEKERRVNLQSIVHVLLFTQ